VRSGVVADAIQALEDDPSSPAISIFQMVYRVEGTPIFIGDMSRADHYAVADEYRQDGEESMFYEAVHRAIGRKLGPTHTTGEVFTEDQLRAMFKRKEAA
jgi:hypothetical protein